MSNLTSAININVNNELKKDATDVLNSLGLNMSSAITLFLTQVVRTESIPFKVVSPKPSRKLRKALKEADDILSGKKKVKAYHNIDELFNDLELDD